MKLLNHVIEFNTRSKRPWRDPLIARRPYYTHIVVGKFSLLFGQPHLEPMTVCAHCYDEIQRVGEDCLDWCEGCNELEGETVEITTEEFEKRHA